MKNKNGITYENFKNAGQEILDDIKQNGISKENLAYLIEETEGMIADLEDWKKREAAKKMAVEK